MKRKLLFLTGLAIGYVVGARAGREKYDKLRAATERYWRDPRVTKVRSDVESYARTQAPIIRDRAGAAAKAAPGAIAGAAKDVADKTSTLARDVADKTSTTAKDVADKTTATAKSVAGRVTDAADDVKDQVVKTASDLRERGEDAVERVTLSVSEARDRALDVEDDEDDLPSK